MRKQQEQDPKLATDGNQVLNLIEAAGMLRVPPERLRKMRQNWGIRSFKVGREIRFAEKDVRDYLDKRLAMAA